MAFRSHIAVLRFLDQGRLQMRPGAIWSEFPILENNKTKTMDANNNQDEIPFRETVRTEWIDYNGHMNVAFYVLAFDHATDVMLEFLKIDHDYKTRENTTTFVADMNVTYRQEVKEGDPLQFRTQILNCDEKRIHFWHEMYHAKAEVNRIQAI